MDGERQCQDGNSTADEYDSQWIVSITATEVTICQTRYENLTVGDVIHCRCTLSAGQPYSHGMFELMLSIPRA